MAFLTMAAPWLFAAGTAVSVLSNEAGARSDQKQLNRMAGSTRATAQRKGIDERRRAKLLDSRARAVAAASGAGASDLDVTNIRGDIEAEGEYRALTQMYEGETEAASLRAQGHELRRAARGKSISTVLGAGSTFAQKYGDAHPATITEEKYA